jgi:hypothetical protein
LFGQRIGKLNFNTTKDTISDDRKKILATLGKPIFTITGGRLKNVTFNWKTVGDGKRIKEPVKEPYIKWISRTFGFSHSFEEAEKWCLTNYLDIQESNNKYLCIEEMYYGLYDFGGMYRFQTFYEWVKAEDGKLYNGNDEGYYKKIGDWPEDLEAYYKANHIAPSIGSIG